MATRRDVLGAFAAALTTGLLTRPRTALAGEPVGMTDDERFLWRMLRGVDVGEPFAGDWVIVDAYPPVAGGVSLVVARGVDGPPLRVDVVRRAEPPVAPAYTEHLELFTMDGGGGVGFVDPALIEALQALAERLEDNDAQFRLSQRLMTHRQRRVFHRAFMDRAAVELQPVDPEALDR